MEKIELNGTDYLMLAFDRLLKRSGLAGNRAQIILGLAEPIPSADFSRRLSAVVAAFPMSSARLKRSFFRRVPYWQVSASQLHCPRVVTHYENESPEPGAIDALRRDLLNTPLDSSSGERIRFDLIHLPDGGGEVVMTWDHVLMDAHGAEYLLYLLGNGSAAFDIPKPAQHAPAPLQKRVTAAPIGEKWQAVQEAFHWIDSLAVLEPTSLPAGRLAGKSPRMDYHIESFSSAQTEAVLERARSLGGLLSDSSVFMAATLKAFDRLNRQKGLHPKGYVASFPISLRKIGTRMPVFTNQAASVLYGFAREELDTIETIAGRFLEQTRQAVSSDLLYANLCLMDLSRYLPLWFYLKKIRQSYKGEIASLIFANPGKTLFGDCRFMGVETVYQHHVPMIVLPPGIGVVFYRFKERLTVSTVFADHLITRQEAAGFSCYLRDLLVSGDG
jgi:hypothetical protein